MAGTGGAISDGGAIRVGDIGAKIYSRSSSVFMYETKDSLVTAKRETKKTKYRPRGGVNYALGCLL